MKVLLFSCQWPEYMIELANSLSKSVNVSLLLPNNHRLTNRHIDLINKSINFYTFNVVFYKSIRDNGKMIYHILRLIWKIKPDIIHIQANGHRLFYLVAMLKPRKSKIINTIHDPIKHLGDEVSYKIKDNFVKLFMKLFTSMYIVHGEYLKKELSGAYNIGMDRIKSIPHGHLEIYKRFKSETIIVKEKNYILFFGRIWKYKGLQLFIDAANIVLRTNRNIKFYIVGTGEPIANYNFDPKNTSNFVIVNRRVTLNEAAHYYQNAAFVVLPYIEATQSGVIPAAYAFSKPVIATNVGAISEVVVDGKTGFLIPKNQVHLLAEKMGMLINDLELTEKMGKQAYNFAKSKLSWESIADKTIKVYEDSLFN